MAEWLYEAGIGEARAALVENGRIVEARIEVEGVTPRVGTVTDARLTEILVPGRRGVGQAPDGAELLIEPLERGWTQGAMVRVEVTREAIHGRSDPKRAMARPASGTECSPGKTLRARIAAEGGSCIEAATASADLLEEAGWSEVLEQARTGVVPFAGGLLRIEATAAMTVIDVDGYLALEELALAAAREAAHTVRRLDIGGSIGIDFPSVTGKDVRQAVGHAVDEALPAPFERTALNGFGFMQIVRPRLRPSLIEHLRADPVGHAARTALRRAQRSTIVGAACIVAAPRVVERIRSHPDWIDQLSRELGGAIALRADPALAISAAYVERA